MKKIFVIVLCQLVIIAPIAFAQETLESPPEADPVLSSEAAPAPPPAPQNEVNLNGDTVVRAERGVTVVGSVVDEQLHNEAMVLRAVGAPLADTGGVLLGISAATWVSWVLLNTVDVIAEAAGEGGSLFGVDTSTISGPIGDATAGLLIGSIALSSVGLAFLITGGIMKGAGDDLRDRAFATPQ